MEADTALACVSLCSLAWQTRQLSDGPVSRPEEERGGLRCPSHQANELTMGRGGQSGALHLGAQESSAPTSDEDPGPWGLSFLTCRR